jgi:hypothetical protein
MASIPASPSRLNAAAPIGQIKTIRLGNALFYPDELPNGLEFGLEQAVTKMEYVGGGRHVQPNGAQQDDVTWSGVFRSNYPHNGMSASDRADDFLRMVTLGKLVKFSWLKRAYEVIPNKFRMKYDHENRVDYTITLVIVRDISGTTTVATIPSADSQVTAIFDRSKTQSNAIVLVDPAAAALRAQVMSTANAVSQSGPVSSLPGSSAGKSILATVQSTLSTAQSYLASLNGAGFTRSHILNAQGLVTSLSLVASQLQAGQVLKSIVVDHGTIEDVALREYGDITLARQLQTANNLPSANIEQGIATKIIIPPLVKSIISNVT